MDSAPVRDLNSEDFSTKPEAQTSEPVKTLARPLVSEAARPREPVRDLKSVLFSARPEAEDSAPVRDLNSELFSARPEAKDSEPVRDLKSEDLSTKLEAEDSEPLNALVIPLVSEAVRESEPLRDLNSELRPVTPEPRFQVAVRGVEQERGLELQVNCPEFT